MNRHYDYCDQEDCIVCRDYWEQRNRDALWWLLAYRRNAGPSQTSLTNYE